MIHPIKRICVFTGSRHGSNPQYAEAARQLGCELVGRNYSLVYGGGNVGLMKVIAEAVLDLGGHVTGVIPDSLVGDGEGNGAGGGPAVVVVTWSRAVMSRV